MYPQRKQRQKLLAEINVVPYVDVMLVLLVIFMITTPLLTQGVKINLPQAQSQTIQTKQLPIIVSIDHFGRYYLNIANKPDQPLAAQELVNQITAQFRLAENLHQIAPPVYVRGDKQTNYGKIVGIMVLLQQAGIDHVGLLTQPFEQT